MLRKSSIGSLIGAAPAAVAAERSAAEPSCDGIRGQPALGTAPLVATASAAYPAQVGARSASSQGVRLPDSCEPASSSVSRRCLMTRTRLRAERRFCNRSVCAAQLTDGMQGSLDSRRWEHPWPRRPLQKPSPLRRRLLVDASSWSKLLCGGAARSGGRSRRTRAAAFHPRHTVLVSRRYSKHWTSRLRTAAVEHPTAGLVVAVSRLDGRPALFKLDGGACYSSLVVPISGRRLEELARGPRSSSRTAPPDACGHGLPLPRGRHR